MKIDKDVPIPESHGTPTFRETVAQMNEGDSVLFTDVKKAKGFARAVRDSGFVAIVDWRAEGGTRIWRGKSKE
jgi:hypothetical protein